MNEDQAPRQNRDGHPCPPWCETDHDAQLIPGYFTQCHSGEDVPTYAVFLSARPCLAPAWDGP